MTSSLSAAARPTEQDALGDLHDRATPSSSARAFCPDPLPEPIVEWPRERLELVGVPRGVMHDDGSPLVAWMPGLPTLFGKALGGLRMR